MNLSGTLFSTEITLIRYLLKSVDFDKYLIKVVSVENNVPDKFNYNSFFKSKNFSFFDRIGQDEVFYNNNYYKLNL